MIIKVNFGTENSPLPSDEFILDFGRGYDNTRGYGFITQASLDSETKVPIDLTNNTRDRDAIEEQSTDTLIHLQYPDGLTGTRPARTNQTPSAWEYDLENGTYQITVGVGDREFTDSEHVVNIEGETAIAGFTPTENESFREVTTIVEVTDGSLTLDAIGGENTKLNFVEIVSEDSIGSEDADSTNAIDEDTTPEATIPDTTEIDSEDDGSTTDDVTSDSVDEDTDTDTTAEDDSPDSVDEDGTDTTVEGDSLDSIDEDGTDATAEGDSSDSVGDESDSPTSAVTTPDDSIGDDGSTTDDVTFDSIDEDTTPEATIPDTTEVDGEDGGSTTDDVTSDSIDEDTDTDATAEGDSPDSIDEDTDAIAEGDSPDSVGDDSESPTDAVTTPDDSIGDDGSTTDDVTSDSVDEDTNTDTTAEDDSADSVGDDSDSPTDAVTTTDDSVDEGESEDDGSTTDDVTSDSVDEDTDTDTTAEDDSADSVGDDSDSSTDAVTTPDTGDDSDNGDSPNDTNATSSDTTAESSEADSGTGTVATPILNTGDVTNDLASEDDADSTGDSDSEADSPTDAATTPDDSTDESGSDGDNPIEVDPEGTGSEIPEDTDNSNGVDGNAAPEDTDSEVRIPVDGGGVVEPVEPIDGGINFNFGVPRIDNPEGFEQDLGVAYSDEQGYGWVTQESAGSENLTPIDVTANGRDRNTIYIDERGGEFREPVRDSFIHMQYPTDLPNSIESVTTPAAWEYDIANGQYEVTVGVGDPEFFDSTQVINIEGEELISGFEPTGFEVNGGLPLGAQAFTEATGTFEVTDGSLTLDAIGGENTKVNYISIVPVDEA